MYLSFVHTDEMCGQYVDRFKCMKHVLVSCCHCFIPNFRSYLADVCVWQVRIQVKVVYMWVNWCHMGGRECVCGAKREKISIANVFWWFVGGSEDCVRYGLQLDFVPVPYHGVWFHCGGRESVITVYNVCRTGLYVQVTCVGSMYVGIGA